jgi:hypothetical protein
MLMNKMPLEFIPDALQPKKVVFQDDQHRLPPVPGWLIRGPPGEPDVFVNDYNNKLITRNQSQVINKQ